MPRSTPTSLDLSTPSRDYEHRSFSDDAWYTIRLLLQSELLIIKYPEFPDPCDDDKYWAGHFDTAEKIRDFEERFRVLSHQIQDRECGSVREGDRVCASGEFGEERKFYNAVVDVVRPREHAFKNGEEECRCTFILSWLHGPKAGTLEASKIENMCLVRGSDKMDPRLATFLRICREKLGISSPGSRSGVGGGTRESYGYTTGRKRRKPDCGISDSSRLSSPSSSMQGKLTSDPMQDLDLGGAYKSKHTVKLSNVSHIVLLDNLEKNITTSAIVNFIGRCTSISTDAYVFPSLWFESYTRGALWVNSAEKLQRLQTFLTIPDQIITSSRGRPWVVPDITKYDSCSASYGFPELNAQIKMPQIKSESGAEEHALKVVHAGSEEYTKAEQLRVNFLDFSNHQHRLHRRLLFEEGRILGPSMC